MNHPTPRRAWRLAAAGALTLALTAGLATWPWNQADIPPAEAQEETTATDGVADSEAEALAESAASGESVEVLALRSELRDVSAEPDGSFTANEYVTPVRTMIDGAWVDIDPTLTVSASGAIAPKATTVQMRFSAGGEEPLVTVAKNGHTMTMDWAGDLPEPAVEGDTAVYAEVLPGVDLRLTALDGGFTHTLVIKSAEAAANPELSQIEWPVSLDGSEVETTPEGGLSVVDSGTLDSWLSTDSPTMWDSAGVEEAVASVPYLASTDMSDQGAAMKVAAEFGAKAPVGITGSGSAIVLTPDLELLRGADTVYPVYIDPVYRDEFRTAQAMVASYYPDQEYWGWTGDQGVGYCVGSGFSNCQKKRLFYRVSSSFYSGKKVISATFGATLYHNYYGKKTSDPANLYLMSSGISSSTNWNNQPSGTHVATENTPEPSYSSCSYAGGHATEWDVTPEVTTAAANGTGTLTFGIRNASESDATKWMRFCNNGHLRVKYNTPPDQPTLANMWSSPGTTCKTSVTAPSSVNTWKTTLWARAYDDDDGDANEWGSTSAVSENLRVKWRLYNKAGALIYESPYSAQNKSGSKFGLYLDGIAAVKSLPSGTEIQWETRASDGFHESSWSHSNASMCRLIYDTTAPAPPTVSSDDFTLVAGETSVPEVADPMVGELGSVAFSSSDTSVTKYRYAFDGATAVDIPLASGVTTASVKHMPTLPGDHLLEVTASDSAGNSVSNTYSFFVSVPAPVGVWSLGDDEGSASASGSDSDNPGTPGSGVQFGAPGPSGTTAAVFDGSANAFIDTVEYGVAPTGAGVSIAAWAKVSNLAKDGVVASIDGGLGEAGMILGYRSTSTTGGKWVLSMPDMALGAFTSWEVTAGTVNATTGWVHLTGVWNDATGQMTLYINGNLANAVSAPRQTTWWGDGTVQIGRANFGGQWAGNFTGSIADVRVFDRVIVPGEAEYLGWQLASRQGLWQFNDHPGDGVTSAEYNGGLPAVLAGGAALNYGRLYDPDTGEMLVDENNVPLGGPQTLVGAGDVLFDGVDDYVSVASPMVDTARSFTLSARVRLSTVTADQAMTVLSIPGTGSSAIEVAYEPACANGKACYVARLRTGDGVGVTTPVTVENTEEPIAEGLGLTLTVVFDATTGQLVLYVGSRASKPLAVPYLSSWTATGKLQIGRGFADGAYGDYFAGAIDDVRAYTGVLHPTRIAQLALATNVDLPNI
jgi:hypothetical protein